MTDQPRRKVSLIGDDDVPPFRNRGAKRIHQSAAEADANFERLQNLGHEENSKDFGDSMFADRRPLEEEQQI